MNKIGLSEKQVEQMLKINFKNYEEELKKFQKIMPTFRLLPNMNDVYSPNHVHDFIKARRMSTLMLLATQASTDGGTACYH